MCLCVEVAIPNRSTDPFSCAYNICIMPWRIGHETAGPLKRSTTKWRRRRRAVQDQPPQSVLNVGQRRIRADYIIIIRWPPPLTECAYDPWSCSVPVPSASAAATEAPSSVDRLLQLSAHAHHSSASVAVFLVLFCSDKSVAWQSMSFNKRSAVRWKLIGIYRWMLNALYGS